MPDIVLEAEVGRTLGSSATRRLRLSGKIPGVIYGHGTEPVPVAVDGRGLRTALSGEAGLNALLSVKAGGTTYLALARDIQRHPVRGTVTHVDFQIVNRDEVIGAEVALHLIGDAVAVGHGDGLVDQLFFSLPVRATPANIPVVIEVDISELTIGAVIRVADLKLPKGAQVELDPETALVIGVPPRVVATTEEATSEEA